MQKLSERVFIENARLSYPALDKPVRSAFDTTANPKYQATFLMNPQNPSVKALQQAIWNVMCTVCGDRAKAEAAYKNPEKNPLKVGDAKENIPEGYHRMFYIKASSTFAPDLLDANPNLPHITGDQIREKFVPGYYVNAFVDIYPYTVKNPAGQILKSGFSAALVSVQFRRYADTFVGSARPAASEYPDCTAEAESSAGDAYSASGYPAAQPAPAPVQQQMTPTQALDMAVAANERAMRQAQSQQQTQQGYQTQTPAQGYQQQPMPDPRSFTAPGQQQGFQDDPMPF